MQSAESQNSILPGDNKSQRVGESESAETGRRHADGKSAIRRVGILRYGFRRKPTRREMVLLLALAVLTTGAAALWRPIQQRWLTWLVLRAEAPAQSLVDGLLSRDAQPGALLDRLWGTKKIPHQLAVLQYLQAHPASDDFLQLKETALLLEAARGGDLEAKARAFAVLATRRSSELRGLALAQLRDVDPAVRVVSLQHLARVGDRQLIPVVIPFLNDSDSRVVAAAGSALGRWTGQDFGIRLSLALPDFKKEIPSGPNSAALSRGVARWMDWWKAHQSDYAAARVELPPPSASWQLPAPDFVLKDLAGRSVQLSSFGGKTLLLSFWATTATNAFSFLSELSEVQRRNQNRFVIVGISLDGSPLGNEPACDDHGDDHAEHAHGATPAGAVHAGHVRHQLEQFIRERGITYQVLLDPTGDIGHRFSALELPTNVIVDRAGHVRRRFVGLRTGAVVEAMMAAADETAAGP